MRPLAAVVLVLLLPSLAACDAPEHALVQRCKTELLSRRVTCGLSAGVVRKNLTASLDPHSKNQKARVQGSFTLEQGKVAVVLLGCADHPRVDVVPGPPVSLTCDSEVDRSVYQLPFDLFAFGEEARGFSGQVVLEPL